LSSFTASTISGWRGLLLPLLSSRGPSLLEQLRNDCIRRRRAGSLNGSFSPSGRGTYKKHRFRAQALSCAKLCLHHRACNPREGHRRLSRRIRSSLASAEVSFFGSCCGDGEALGLNLLIQPSIPKSTSPRTMNPTTDVPWRNPGYLCPCETC
jgi:hypothetical protein